MEIDKMEIIGILLITVLSTIMFPLLFKLCYGSKSTRLTTRSAAPLPPGKMGLPVLGESMEFISNIRKGTPERFFQDRIRKYTSSTFKTSLLGDPTIVMHGAAGNKFLFGNEEKLVRAWWPKTIRTLFPSSVLNEFRVRDLADPFIKADGLRNYVGIMDTMAQTHLESKWQGQNEVMVYPMAMDYTFTLACRLFLSTNDTDFIAKLAGPVSKLKSGFLSLPINLRWTKFGQAVRASKAIFTRLTTVIRKRRQELSLAVATNLDYKSIASHQDILSHMLLSSDENGKYMSDIEMADRVMGLLIAGHDTASVVITVIFKYLGANPEIYHKVFKEQMEISRNKEAGEVLNWHDILKMKYSWNVALEAMRIYPPVQSTFREAIRDFTYAGYHVPKGWKLHMSIYATHRDSKYFPEPEKFDPSRFDEGGPLPYTFVPFGGGPRMCPGRNYAQIEILAFLHNVVKRFKWEIIDPDEEIIVDPIPKPTKGLPIRLHPHQTHPL